MCIGKWHLGDQLPFLPTRQGSDGWGTASSTALNVGDRRQLAVSDVPGDSVLHNTALDVAGKKGAALTSVRQDSDVEFHIEFQLASGSNSGVYFMGRYEIQLLDSFGKADSDLKYSDCGGIYQRWDETKDPKGYEGTAPTTNASRPAGEWQSLDVLFRAPRFDADGNKIANAMFERVVLNGTVIHENVSCTGPTRGQKLEGEAATGPIVLQGAHGPVAFRNIWIRPQPAAK